MSTMTREIFNFKSSKIPEEFLNICKLSQRHQGLKKHPEESLNQELKK